MSDENETPETSDVAETADEAVAAVITEERAKAPVADAADPEGRHNGRKVREGLVVAASMDKTVVVAIVNRVRHPVYSKTVQKTTRLYAHDESNDAKVGDRVRVAETRPLSKLKRWRLVSVVERAR